MFQEFKRICAPKEMPRRTERLFRDQESGPFTVVLACNKASP
jgi:hypothetical protein